MITKTEEWLYNKAKEVHKDLEIQDLYTAKFSFGGRWVMDLLEEYHKEQLLIQRVVRNPIADNHPIEGVNEFMKRDDIEGRQLVCPLPETKGCDIKRIIDEDGRWVHCNTCKREWAD